MVRTKNQLLRGDPSSLCLDALLALGGEYTSSVFGLAILAIVRESDQDAKSPLELCQDALRLLGGEYAFNALAKAILGIVRESIPKKVVPRIVPPGPRTPSPPPRPAHRSSSVSDVVSHGDARDRPTWIALELSKTGELKAIEGSLADTLRLELDIQPTHPVFVPYANYSKGGRKVSVRLIEGYAFIASGLVETRYFALERGHFVERVMSSKGAHNMRVLQTIPDQKIQEMITQLRSQVSSDLEVGTKVRIVGGNYHHLDGVIVDIQGERAAVRITMRSIDVVTYLPKVFLDASTEEEEASGGIDPLDIAVGPEFIPEGD